MLDTEVTINQSSTLSISRQHSLVVLLLLLKFVTDAVYVYILSSVYNYAGFTLDISYGKYVVSILLTVILGMLLKSRVRNPSDFLLVIIVSFMILPIISIWALRDQPGEFLFIVLIGFSLTWLMTKLPKISFTPLADGYRIFIILTVGLSLLYLFFYLTRGGLSYFSFNISDVYRSRDIFEKTVLYDEVVYLARWFGKIACVAGISVALARRSKSLFAMFFTLGIASFFMTTAREQLVYPFIPIGIFYLCKHNFSLSRWMIGLYTVLIVIGVLVYWNFGNISLLSFSALRGFFAIGQNNYLYYQFFIDHQPVLFSQNLLSWAIDYPYSVPIPEIIGEGRYGGQGSFSNAGLYASGFMQAGVWGVAAYSVLTGLIIRLIDSFVAKGIPLHIGLSIGFVMVYQFVNIDILTALLTQGAAYALLLLYFLSGTTSKFNRIGKWYE